MSKKKTLTKKNRKCRTRRNKKFEPDISQSVFGENILMGYPEVFNDHNWKRSKYLDYGHRAVKLKNISFNIIRSQFENLCKMDCYICSKFMTSTHQNGIDRVNNNYGYYMGNVQPCCGDCNYLKRDSVLSEFISKCIAIVKNHQNRLIELRRNWVPSRYQEKNLNKVRLSPEEKKEKLRMKKEMRHQQTMISKTPEAIQERAAEIRAAYEKKLFASMCIIICHYNCPLTNLSVIIGISTEDNSGIEYDFNDESDDSDESQLVSNESKIRSMEYIPDAEVKPVSNKNLMYYFDEKRMQELCNDTRDEDYFYFDMNAFSALISKECRNHNPCDYPNPNKPYLEI